MVERRGRLVGDRAAVAAAMAAITRRRTPRTGGCAPFSPATVDQYRNISAFDVRLRVVAAGAPATTASISEVIGPRDGYGLVHPSVGRGTRSVPSVRTPAARSPAQQVALPQPDSPPRARPRSRCRSTTAHRAAWSALNLFRGRCRPRPWNPARTRPARGDVHRLPPSDVGGNLFASDSVDPQIGWRGEVAGDDHRIEGVVIVRARRGSARVPQQIDRICASDISPAAGHHHDGHPSTSISLPSCSRNR